jgi:hypothetical protein
VPWFGSFPRSLTFRGLKLVSLSIDIGGPSVKSRTCAKNFKRGELVGLVVYPRPESGERVCTVEVTLE